jgi:hypothetical protein
LKQDSTSSKPTVQNYGKHRSTVGGNGNLKHIPIGKFDIWTK